MEMNVKLRATGIMGQFESTDRRSAHKGGYGSSSFRESFFGHLALTFLMAS